MTRGLVAVAGVCAAPIVLWAASVELGDRFAGTFVSLTSIAVLLALAGTSAFALNLVLGARLRLVEAFFGGLDRMYRTHRVTGQVSFGLLTGHVVLILASRATISAEAALDLLGPGAGWTVFTGVLAFAAMTVALVLTLFVRLGHEVFVYVQRSFGLAFLVASYHVFTTPGAKQGSTALSVYIGAVAALGIAAFVYRSVLGNLLVLRRPYRVVAVNRLDECVTELVMEPLARPLVFAPGQFVFVSFRSPQLREALRPFELSLRREILSIRPGDARKQFHPFSITSAAGDRTLRVTVKAVGDYTRAIRRLEPAAEAVVEGPYGSFSHWNVPARRQIWAAGGIGVTPFLSMARSLTDDDPTEIDFYYCVEREAEAHFLEELRAIARRRAGLRVVLVARDEHGLLTGRRIAEECDLAAADVFVCGPPGMIGSLRAQLEREGVPGDRIHAEEFGFAKPGRTALGRDGVEGDWAPTPAPTDRATLALLGAVAFAGPALAVAVVVGAYAAARVW